MAITDKNKSTVERLKDLCALYEAGILTKEEMEAEKAEILGKAGANDKTNGQDNMPDTDISECDPAEDNPSQDIADAQNAADDNEEQEPAETTAKNVLSRKTAIIAAVVAAVVIIIVVAAGKCGGTDDDAAEKKVALTTSIELADVLSENAADSGFHSETHRAIDGASVVTTSVAEFFAIPEVANAVQNEYGIDYFNFLKGIVSSCKNTYLDFEKNSDGDGSVTSYTFSTVLDAEDHWLLDATYDAQADNLQLSLSSDGNVVTPEGRFALADGSKWKLDFEKDEFGDPIQEKAFVYVEGEADAFSTHMKMAIPLNDESHIIFYYDLPISDMYDHHALSIKIKDKTDDSVYEISDGKAFRDHYVLTEKDSRYIRQLCDSNPSGSFSIRFDITDYDLFLGSEKNYTIVNFDNGMAYGAGNAIAHYSKRAFTVN